MKGDRGQTEVLGSILMVVITVVAISTVGGALFTANAPSDHPNVETEATANGTNLFVEHRAGEPIHDDEFEIHLQETGTTMAGTDGVPSDSQSDGDEVFEPGEVWMFDSGASISSGETAALLFTKGDGALIDETKVNLESTTTTPTTSVSERDDEDSEDGEDEEGGEDDEDDEDSEDGDDDEGGEDDEDDEDSEDGDDDEDSEDGEDAERGNGKKDDKWEKGAKGEKENTDDNDEEGGGHWWWPPWFS